MKKMVLGEFFSNKTHLVTLQPNQPSTDDDRFFPGEEFSRPPVGVDPLRHLRQ
jgi:hypothetical protein